jgi:hypothetical protein
MKAYLALCELTNQTNASVDFQRVQHPLFGAALDPRPHARLALSVQAGIT